jgi:hypothetical protein
MGVSVDVIVIKRMEEAMKNHKYRFGFEYLKRQLDLANKYNMKHYGFKIVIVKKGESNGTDERKVV